MTESKNEQSYPLVLKDWPVLHKALKGPQHLVFDMLTEYELFKFASIRKEWNNFIKNNLNYLLPKTLLKNTKPFTYLARPLARPTPSSIVLFPAEEKSEVCHYVITFSTLKSIENLLVLEGYSRDQQIAHIIQVHENDIERENFTHYELLVKKMPKVQIGTIHVILNLIKKYHTNNNNHAPTVILNEWLDDRLSIADACRHNPQLALSVLSDNELANFLPNEERKPPSRHSSTQPNYVAIVIFSIPSALIIACLLSIGLLLEKDPTEIIFYSLIIFCALLVASGSFALVCNFFFRMVLTPSPPSTIQHLAKTYENMSKNIPIERKLLNNDSDEIVSLKIALEKQKAVLEAHKTSFIYTLFHNKARVQSSINIIDESLEHLSTVKDNFELALYKAKEKIRIILRNKVEDLELQPSTDENFSKKTTAKGLVENLMEIKDFHDLAIFQSNLISNKQLTGHRRYNIGDTDTYKQLIRLS